MKKNKFKNIKAGIFTILPIVVFIFIITLVINILLVISNNLFLFLPKELITENNEIAWYWHVAVIGVLFVFTWLIGVLMNHYYVGGKIKKILQLTLERIPILKTLLRISKQINEISSEETSFKEVVLVEFPTPGIYSIGFITSERVGTLQKILTKKVYSVFIPTTPNPTNGFIVIVSEEKLVRTKIPIASAIEYVISMGTLVDLEHIETLEKK